MAKRKFIPIPTLTASDIARFWKKVLRLGPDDCWLWTACITSRGYGRFGRRGMFLAHRIAYFLEHGIDPGSMCVCHKCDNPLCQNPSHLFAASQKENMHDCIAKGRFSAGDNHFSHIHPEWVARGARLPQTKLTEADVVEIRALYATGQWLHRELAAKFGVRQSAISRIMSRKRWRHLA